MRMTATSPIRSRTVIAIELAEINRTVSNTTRLKL